VNNGALPANAPKQPGLDQIEIARFVLDWRASQQRTRRER